MYFLNHFVCFLSISTGNWGECQISFTLPYIQYVFMLNIVNLLWIKDICVYWDSVLIHSVIQPNLGARCEILSTVLGLQNGFFLFHHSDDSYLDCWLMSSLNQKSSKAATQAERKKKKDSELRGTVESLWVCHYKPPPIPLHMANSFLISLVK